MISRRLFLTGTGGIVALCAAGVDILEAHAAPSRFVSIEEYSAAQSERICVDPVYATTRNFVGRPLNGYAKRECLSTPEVIGSLMSINRGLQHREDLVVNLQLLVKDVYRPQEATDDMVRWALSQPNPEFYLGKYIARQSTHKSGSTVDVTLATCTGREVWMGSYFDEFNHNAHFGITRDFTPKDLQWAAGSSYFRHESMTTKQLREVLREEMEKEGFKPYALEWWHFSKK